MPIVDREHVRQFVAADNAFYDQARKAGLNIHQLSLDRTDTMQEFATSLPESLGEKFYDLYIEEMNAAALALNADTAQLVTQTHQQNVDRIISTETWGAIGAFVLGVIGFLWLMLSRSPD